MGREVRRVALDFDWPLKKRWEGFINPHKTPRCGPCEGTGASPGSRLFSAQWYGQAPFDPAAYGATPLTVDHPGVMAFARRNVERDPGFFGGASDRSVRREAERLWGHWHNQWSHHLIQVDVDALVAADRLYDFKGQTPTAQEVNDWSIAGGMGHDSINQWVCVKARCKREKVKPSCSACRGSGENWPSEAAKKAHDDWKPTDPPEGEGWQMWETTSEGSPISPVFKAPEELARWLADTNASAFGSSGASYGSWLRMIVGPGWAPSAVSDEHGLRSGVEAVQGDVEEPRG